MGRFFRIAIAIVLAACGQGGAQIVVDPAGAQIDHVVLYIGVGTTQNDPIAPESYSTPLHPVEWWQRDPHNVLDQQAVAGKPVTFAFEEGTTTELPLVVAVGYAGDTAVVAAERGPIEIPPDMIARYTLTLQPFADPTMPGQGGGLALQLWQAQGSSDPAATCVHVEAPDLAKPALLVGDPDDPDCDGFSTGSPMECAPHVYRGHSRPSLDQVNCLAPETERNTTGSVQACTLGGPACIDGQGPQAGSCAASVYCIPKSDCDACANVGGNPFDCLTDVTIANATAGFTHIECTVSVDPMGNLCNADLTALDVTVDLGGPMCTGQVLVAHAAGGFANQVTITGPNGTMQLEAKDLQPSCNFTLIPSGTWPLADGAHLAALAVADLDNGRGIGIPVVFSNAPMGTTTCVPATCRLAVPLVPSDGARECVNAPVF